MQGDIYAFEFHVVLSKIAFLTAKWVPHGAMF